MRELDGRAMADGPASLSTRPFLAVYVVWHPNFKGGSAAASAIHNHYRRNLFVDIAGGTGLSVIYRSEPQTGNLVPSDIDFCDAEATAVIVLVDEHLSNDTKWIQYVQALVKKADETGLRTRVFPVAIYPSAYKISKPAGDLNFIRWDAWFGDSEEDRHRKLIFQLTYQFCRMLRVYLAHLQHPLDSEANLTTYLERVRIFLSHSKHDDYGEKIAKSVRGSILAESDLDAFFDVVNIPPGVKFADVLVHNVSVSAVVAIHTDSYSSREWCRREILEAKRFNVPLVVANCITDFEERGFPYMGNVPVIRMEPDADHRIAFVIGRLLDEILKGFLWRCRTELAKKSAATDIKFLPRAPELVSVVTILHKPTTSIRTVVYPDPPLGAEELALFESLSDDLTLYSYTEWLASSGV